MGSLENRLPIWMAISEFYLDTELQEKNYQWIYVTFKESGKTIDELKEIDLFEVFPSLQVNLNSVAGEWAGFDENWLKEVCSKNFNKKHNRWFRFITRLRNIGTYGMRQNHWRKIEQLFESKLNG